MSSVVKTCIALQLRPIAVPFIASAGNTETLRFPHCKWNLHLKICLVCQENLIFCVGNVWFFIYAAV